MATEPTWRAVGLPPINFPGRIPSWDDLRPVLHAEPFNDFFHPSRTYKFVVEKPDEDLYFPINSRKFRGWYQVRAPHRPSVPHPVLSGCHIRDAPATETNIPGEVVRQIIQLVDFDLADPTPVRQQKKHQLAACALVSRSWVSFCQSKLFYSITLCCAADVSALLSFVRDTKSPIREYIHDLRIHPYTASCEPWLHRVASLYPHLRWLPPSVTGFRFTDYSQSIPVVFRGPVPCGQGVVRSIHQALPRRTPEFSKHIQRLCLSDITFRNFADLAYLVSELADLQHLDCARLSIEGSLPQPPVVLGFNPTVTMTRCDHSWASMWLYNNRLPTRRRNPHSGSIDVDDWARIATLASLIAAGYESATELVPTSELDGEMFPTWGLERTVPLKLHTISLTYKLSDSQFMTLFVAAEVMLPQSRLLYVSKLQLIISFGKTNAPDYDCWTRINWADFDRAAAAFPHLGQFRLDFMLESDMMSFLINEKPCKTGFSELNEKRRTGLKLECRFHFESQPLDWPMGAFVCKVGLRPRRPPGLLNVLQNAIEKRSRMIQRHVAQLISSGKVPYRDFTYPCGACFRRYNIDMEEIEASFRIYVDPTEFGCEDTTADMVLRKQNLKERTACLPNLVAETGHGGLGESEGFRDGLEHELAGGFHNMKIIIDPDHSLKIAYVALGPEVSYEHTVTSRYPLQDTECPIQ